MKRDATSVSGRPRWRRWLTGGGAVACLLVWTCCGCSVRENRLIRSWLYPATGGERTALGAETEGAAFDHAGWTSLLQEAVGADGVVDYTVFQRRKAELDAYMKALAEVEGDRLSRHAQAALRVNAYNAFTVALMLEHPAVESIKDIPEADRWVAKRWTLGGETVSLDELEHAQLRTSFFDPRWHFALVCASKGCPWLRNEAYTAAALSDQLDDQARQFFARTDSLRFASGNRVEVSELMDWFRGDFTDGDRNALVGELLPWFPDDVRQAIGANSLIRVSYLKYDWTLNGHF